MILKIIKTEVEPHLSGPVVLVDAEGPRKGSHLYAVTLDRRGNVRSVVRTEPLYMFFSSGEEPPEIIAAAVAAFSEYSAENRKVA
jgi:hypothetical protein